MKNLNALMLLKDSYISDEEEEEEGCDRGDHESKSSSVKEPLVVVIPELPIPETLQNFLVDESEDSEMCDDPELHDGRVRSFAHERGNWATCLFVPIRNVNPVKSLCDGLLSHITTVGEFHICKDFHVSFSRTVILRHHWIQLFVDSIGKDVRKLRRFPMNFEELEVFVNDERTRTFLALKVNYGCNSLLQLVECADKNLSAFRLPGYYKDPKFHMSILWCVGDREEELITMMSTLQENLDELRAQDPQLWCIDVDEVHIKTGNRLYRFSLRDIIEVI